jgi:predicted transcriptional regulator
MVAVLPGGNSTFVPSHEASGSLVIDYARNIKKFAVNQYTQVKKVDKSIFYYMKMNFDENGRIIDSSNLDNEWADGESAPGGRANGKEFEYLAGTTRRYVYPFTLGDKAVAQATWDIVASHAAAQAQRAMTARTMLALKSVLTTGNHLSSHVIDISAVSGNTGTWAASTSNRQDIKRSLNVARDTIIQDSLGAIDADDLNLVINPTLARQLSECQEIVEYIKGSPDALAQIKGELSGGNQNAMFGLPQKLYGVNLIVEKTVRVTSKKRATSAKSYVLPTATPFMTVRPGSLEAPFGGPNFSAITGFMYEEMSTETKKDRDNRRTSGRVVEDYVYILTSQEGAVMFQNAV